MVAWRVVGMDFDNGQPTTYVVRALELFEDYGDREALVGGDRRLTYTEVRNEVLRMALALRAFGVTPGSNVLVMVANPLEGPILQLAVHLLGCRSFWVAPVTARREIDEYVRLSGADTFVYDTRSQGALGAEIGSALSVPVLCLGPGGVGPDLLAADGRTASPTPRRSPRAASRRRCSRPAAPPARPSWCTSPTTSSCRSSPSPSSSSWRPVRRCCGTCPAPPCGWSAGRSPRSSTCSPAACCSSRTPGRPASSSPPWTARRSTRRSCRRRCSTRCSTTPRPRPPT